MWAPLALAVLSLAAPPAGLPAVPAGSAVSGAVAVVPTWVTLDVLNPEQSGQHRVLHLGDVLAGRADIPGLPTAKSLLVVASTLDACTEQGLCAALSGLAEKARARGGLAVLVLLDGAEAEPRAKLQIRKAAPGLPVAFDARSVVRRALGLTSAGEAVVLHADGRMVRLARSLEGRGLEEVERTFLRDLDRLREEGE